MIRPATEKDLDSILDIHRRAFEEEDEAELVTNLLSDPTAAPYLSLVAEKDGDIIAHVLFTKASVEGSDLTAMLLAPLAVDPDFHFKGTGQRLMKDAFARLKEMSVDLVFVLGPPDYYPRVGFLNNAGAKGFPTPHPIPKKHADAWMVMALRDGALDGDKGRVQVADAISPAEYWGE